MKILYDYQIFDMHKFGGISRYFYELFNNFNNFNDIEYTIPIKYSDNIYLNQLDNIKNNISPKRDQYKEFFWNLDFKGKKILYYIKKKFIKKTDYRKINRELSIDEIKKNDYEIFHPTFFDPYFLDYIKNKPFVITVYDMIHEYFPEHFPLQESNIIKWKEEIILKAKKVIAISNSTKNDILKFIKVDPDKIEVIHLAGSFPFGINNIKVSYKIPEKFILYVGGRMAYKNFYFLLYCISSLLIEDKDLYLICTGGPFNKDEILFFQNHSLEKKIIHYNVDDSMLQHLYKNALAFVFPSIYEGFGIPILEAFSCGCPVISSDRSSLPEVGSNACEYFNPKDKESIFSAVKKVIYNEDLRKDLIVKGHKRLKLFSWKECSEKTKVLYESILNN